MFQRILVYSTIYTEAGQRNCLIHNKGYLQGFTSMIKAYNSTQSNSARLSQSVSSSAYKQFRAKVKTLKVAKRVINDWSSVNASPFNTQIKWFWNGPVIMKVKLFVANAHMLTEAYRHLELSLVLKNADLVTLMEYHWFGWWLVNGARAQNHVARMDILLSLCQQAPLQY